MFAFGISRALTFFQANKIKTKITNSSMFIIGSLAITSALFFTSISYQTISFALCFLLLGFGSGLSYNTSISCPICNYIDKKNRKEQKFLCQNCNYADDADIVAARNILNRFLTGPYGAGCKMSNNHGMTTFKKLDKILC